MGNFWPKEGHLCCYGDTNDSYGSLFAFTNIRDHYGALVISAGSFRGRWPNIPL